MQLGCAPKTRSYPQKLLRSCLTDILGDGVSGAVVPARMRWMAAMRGPNSASNRSCVQGLAQHQVAPGALCTYIRCFLHEHRAAKPWCAGPT